MFISYLLRYVLTHTQIQGAYVTYLGVSLACMLVFLIGLGRSPITFALLAASYCWPISLQNNENYLFYFLLQEEFILACIVWLMSLLAFLLDLLSLHFGLWLMNT